MEMCRWLQHAQYGAQTASGGVHEGNISMETQLRMGQYKTTVFCTITLKTDTFTCS